MLKINAYQQVNLPERVNRPQAPSKVPANPAATAPSDFRATLGSIVEQQNGVKFSAHAKARLHSRGVQLDEARLEALSQAIDKAQAKGSRESLILADEAAYVVSVKNRTVITAFDRDNLRDGVFTAIDSAVIL